MFYSLFISVLVNTVSILILLKLTLYLFQCVHISILYEKNHFIFQMYSFTILQDFLLPYLWTVLNTSVQNGEQWQVSWQKLAIYQVWYMITISWVILLSLLFNLLSFFTMYVWQYLEWCWFWYNILIVFKKKPTL